MRGIFRRDPRLRLVAGLGIALAMPALAVIPSRAQGIDTTTTLTAQSSESGTCSLTSLAVAVISNAGVPSNTVTIEDEAGNSPVQLASALLDSGGQANMVLALTNGDHSLSAIYAGDATFKGSASTPVSVTVSSQCAAPFVVTASNLAPSTSSATTLTLIPGQSGTGTVTVIPLEEFASSLTAPAFVTISCSGLPDLASCAFTPENIEILPGQGAGVTSSMVIQTYAASTTSLSPPARPDEISSPIAWAFLLPGALGLGGLAWGTRRRRGPHGQVFVRGVVRPWLNRLSLLALLGLVTLLGTTACNPRYYYENHGPQPNPPTPAGSYTVKIAAQSNNGVTAQTDYTSFTLTVK